jgi:uncharacterized protein (DUF58 family)
MAKIAGNTPVPLWRLFWRMGGWVALIFGGPFLVLTLISSLSLSLAQRFDAEGRETGARVVDRYETVSTDSDGDRTTTYSLVLTFKTNRGAEVTVTHSVGSNLYHSTEVGDFTGIWYLESAPDKTELNRGENRSLGIVTQTLALLFGLLWLAALWVPGRKAGAAVRARRYGARETAEVTGVTQTNWKVNNQFRYRLTWREKSGRTGESLGYPHALLRGYEPGSRITVYQGIKRAWWSGDVGERAEAPDG